MRTHTCGVLGTLRDGYAGAWGGFDIENTAEHIAPSTKGTVMPLPAARHWLRASMTKTRARAQTIVRKLSEGTRSDAEERALKLAHEYLAATEHFYE